MSRNVFGTKNIIIDGMIKNRSLMRKIGKKYTKISDSAFPRNGKMNMLKESSG